MPVWHFILLLVIIPGFSISQDTTPVTGTDTSFMARFRHAADSILHLKDLIPRPGRYKRQDSARLGKDSIVALLLAGAGRDTAKFHKDSLFTRFRKLPAESLKNTLAPLKAKPEKPDSFLPKKKLASLLPYSREDGSSLVQVGGGYVQYNYMFRSVLDTPFVETDLGQHMITAGLDFAMAGIPFRLTYYGRQSNSQYLRNYHDFRVEFNGPEFRRLKQQQLRNQLTGALQNIQPQGLGDRLKNNLQAIRHLRTLLSAREWLNKYLESKKYLTYRDQLPTELPDKEMVIRRAEGFVKLYEEKQRLGQSLLHETDSLQSVYNTNLKKIQELQRLIDRNIYTEQGTRLIGKELQEAGIRDRKTQRLLNTVYAVRTFAVGRTLPRMSQLSVNNLNVGGVNFEYNAYNLYLAFTAGKIDFRSRDFIYGKPSPVKQHVYAGSIGYGRKDGTHLIVTGYTGRKQIISAGGLASSPLSGMSIEAQWAVGRYVRITAEAAQSTSPVYASEQGNKAQGFKINDPTNKAYLLKAYGYIPASQTRIEGYYNKTGINFQNFTNYRVNANTSTWNIKAEQYLFKKQLRIMASARKNDYSNPFVIQQYNSNTVFTSLSATFRRRRLPSLTIGYMPSSQYTMAGNQVAENRYQSLNIHMAHTYRIGLMTANGSVVYNRFYNSGSDTGFVYYNASHFYSSHQFMFRMFTASMGYARTANRQYALDVMEGGLAITWFKKIVAGFGVRINQYNQVEVKTGGYFNLRCNWPAIGDLSVWYENAYLPGSSGSLVKNEWFTLGFTRYFNNRIRF
ncbi:MAG: hypothetical protein KF746_11190 [Chitinophagaceae bacterium]|nr:hypothetical protein [Chitinophagaceae bacterium]